LSGGGANGAYEVGVMKALFTGASPATGYQPLVANIFTGTSVGCFNASFMVSQPGTASAVTLSELENVWLEKVAENPGQCGNGVFRFRGDFLDFFSVQCLTAHPLKPLVELTGDGIHLAQEGFKRAVNLFTPSSSLEGRLLDFIDVSAFISIEPFRHLVREVIRLEGIRQSDKKLRVVATNWETGEVRIFLNEHMTDEIGHQAILASAAMPGLFPPVLIAGVQHVDGGVVMNTPIKPAIEAGADVIHIIYLDPDIRNIPLERVQGTLDVFDRLMSIQFAIKVQEDAATIDWINRGSEVLERVSRSQPVPDAALRSFIQTASQIARRLSEGKPYRKITVHRYQPREDLGGTLSVLNFNRERILNLIERGYTEAVEHRCEVNQCILPGRNGPAQSTSDIA
jgi:NTE family protein